MIRYAMLFAIVWMAGCGPARDTNTVPPFEVTFFGVDLSTQTALDIRRIALRDLPTVAECPWGVGLARPVSIRHSSEELRELLQKHSGVASLPALPCVQYSLSRDQRGRFAVEGRLWVGTNSIAEREVALRVKEGEWGVLLLPDDKEPRYAVCYVVTRIPTSSSQTCHENSEQGATGSADSRR